MTTIKLSAIPFVLFACSVISAQSSTYVKDNVKHSVEWKDMVNSIVLVDGLAWGAFEKGLGSHLVLARGRVYLKNVDLLKNDLNGRLVRISGYLRKGRIERAPLGAQGYSKSFEYFYIESFAASRIAKIEHSQLLRSTDAWIAPGMLSGDVAKLVESRKYKPYALAISSSKDGSKPRSFKIDNNHVLVIYELKNQVKSISKIKLNGVGKGDDEWVAIPAFKLPPIRKGAR